MVSVCLPSDALLQHLPSYLGFSYLGHGVSLHGCSSKAQPLLLTLDEGYLLTATLPDLQRGIAPLGPPAPTQPRLLGRGVGPLGHPSGLGCGVAPPRCRPWPRAWGVGYLLAATAPDLGRGVTPLGPRPWGMGSSRLLPLISDVGWLLSAVLSVPVTAACAFHSILRASRSTVRKMERGCTHSP